MCREKRNRKRVGSGGVGWKKGAAVAAANASRWRYQGTDVNGDGVYLSCACWFLRLAFSKRIESKEKICFRRKKRTKTRKMRVIDKRSLIMRYESLYKIIK